MRYKRFGSLCMPAVRCEQQCIFFAQSSPNQLKQRSLTVRTAVALISSRLSMNDYYPSKLCAAKSWFRGQRRLIGRRR